MSSAEIVANSYCNERGKPGGVLDLSSRGTAGSDYITYVFTCNTQTFQPQQTSFPQITTPKTSMDSAKAKCSDLGFKSGTQEFGKCVLQLSK